MKKFTYVGLTYPKLFGLNVWLWKKFMCPRHIHLFDECLSSEHVLVCDACGLVVHIALIETNEESLGRAKNGKYIETSAVETKF